MTIYINVSNTFYTRANTGIQRVVREVVSRLVHRSDIILIAWSKSDFYQISLAHEIIRFMAAKPFEPKNKIKLEQLRKGDIFVDADASWVDTYDIKQLYQMLKKQGVILTKLHYDAVPILFPQFSRPNTVFAYTDNFSAALQYCDYWLCISQTVRSDLLKISEAIGIGQPTIQNIPLGADFNNKGQIQNQTIASVEYGKYILVVGTLEPRKNHQLILDVFDQLQLEDEPVNLVIAGKRGWQIGEIIERIENHPSLNKRLFWLQNATDAEIQSLYKNAFVTANLSHYEGYGLPVIESLSLDCVTLCATNTAMEEVAQGSGYCVNADTKSVVNALKQLAIPRIYSEYKHRAEHFVAPKWGDSATAITGFLENIQQLEEILYTPRQAVYISIRADALYKSINSIIKNMSFINKVVILSSDKEFAAISKKLESLAIDITLVKESDLGIKKLPEDAQMRATFLRRRLYETDMIEPNFIAFDDDSLAIKPVYVSDFLENARHKAYYYYDDGRDWLGAYPQPTSFDQGIWRTVKFLYSSGYATRLYNSHMPQILNKKLSSLIFNRTAGLGLDEWSCYFNMAKHLYPQYFSDHIYRTITWPPDFESWLPSVQPEKITFQNYYENDIDLVAKTPKKIAEKIDKWLAEYAEKKDIEDSIVPENPVIDIGKAGLTFNGSSIKCHKSAKINIKFVVDVNHYQIQCQYDMHEQDYDENSLPRYLFIPAKIFNPAGDNTINVSLSLTNTNQVFELSIPVTIVK